MHCHVAKSFYKLYYLALVAYFQMEWECLFADIFEDYTGDQYMLRK